MSKKKTRSKNKQKKKTLLFIVLFIIIIALSVAAYFFYFKETFKYKSKITIEVGDAVPTIKDYLYKEEDLKEELIWENIEPEEGKIYKTGTYNGKIKHKDEEYNITLIVKDTISPVIEGVKDIEMLAYDKKPDFLKDITASDNSREEIKVTVEGEYDTEKVGEYTLTYTAKDSSNNIAKKDCKLKVKENKNVSVSKTSKGYVIKKYFEMSYIDNNLIVNKTYSLPSNYIPSNLVTINGYIKVVDYVRDAFNNLKSDATSMGLNIYASSGYRSYNDQKYIYDNYVRMDGVEKADTYSARAGHSEHQTGLAIDLNTVDSSFDNTNESNWLKENCYKYGFIIRYPKDKDNITGYMYEPWHIRYVGNSLAEKLYNKGNWLTLEEYYGIDSKYN